MSCTFFITNRENEAETLTLSNFNTFALLRQLGIEPDYCGSVASYVLIGKIKTLFGTVEDEGVLDLLFMIAVKAAISGATVTWA